jgi:hypothetical protein
MPPKPRPKPAGGEPSIKPSHGGTRAPAGGALVLGALPWVHAAYCALLAAALAVHLHAGPGAPAPAVGAQPADASAGWGGVAGSVGGAHGGTDCPTWVRPRNPASEHEGAGGT